MRCNIFYSVLYFAFGYYIFENSADLYLVKQIISQENNFEYQFNNYLKLYYIYYYNIYNSF